MIESEKKAIKNKLIHMFKLVLMDSQDMWILNYCSSDNLKEERINKDMLFLNEFYNLLNKL